MEYRDDDRLLFGLREEREGISGWWAVAFLVLLIVGNLSLAGCDGQAAEATHESVMAATEKKQALMGHPCTYVAQCGYPISACPVSRRACVPSADLSERK